MNPDAVEVWPDVRVRELVELENGYPFDSAEFGPAGALPLVRIRDLTSTDFQTFISGYAPPRIVLRNGDVVIGMDGDFNVVRWDRGPAVLNQRLCLLRPRAGCDIRFVEYALPDHLRFINETQYATTVKHLSSGEILRVRISAPSIEEQGRIADFLDDQVSRINQAIDARRRQEVVLQEEIGALAHAEVTGAQCSDRKASGLAWSLDLPSHWRSTRLANVARLGTGHTPSRLEPEYWLDCDVPWVTTTDVKRFRYDGIDSIADTEVYISQLGLRNSSAVVHPKGTVVLTRTSASAGFSIVMDAPMATSQDCATWTPGPLLDSFYALWCLRAMRRDLMERLAMGSTHKTIYFPDLEGIRIPLPPLVEQRSIVERISSRVSVIRSSQGLAGRSIQLLEERKRALITAAVTGEFDVTTASGRGSAFL